MSDLTKLTTEELLAFVSTPADWSAGTPLIDQMMEMRWKAEIRRRLERLEKCEAALKEIKAVETKFGTGRIVGKFDAKQCRSIARAALEGR